MHPLGGVKRPHLAVSLAAALVLGMLPSVPVSAAGATCSVSLDDGTLVIRVVSPVEVKDAQVRLNVSEGVEVVGFQASGFLKGADHLYRGSEHRFFVLRTEGSYGKEGELRVELQAAPGARVSVLGVYLKDPQEQDIPVSAEFPIHVDMGGGEGGGLALKLALLLGPTAACSVPVACCYLAWGRVGGPEGGGGESEEDSEDVWSADDLP